MTKYRTLNDVSVAYFAEHPEEVDLFLQECFADYGEDGDSAALLFALRIVAHAKEASQIVDRD